MRVHVQRARVPLIGVVVVAATGHGVVAVRLGDDVDGVRRDVAARFPEAETAGAGPLTTEACQAIRAYLDGGEDPDVPVVLPEVGFATRVWRQIARIPRGQVRSYGRLARALRRPQAARAVGQACGRNPVPLLVPCHRVVAADGSLGGFTGGLAIKRRLLALEGAHVR